VNLQSITRSFGAFHGSERQEVPSAGQISGVLMDDFYHRVTGLAGRLYVKEIVYGTETITHAPLRAGSARTGTALRIFVGHDGALLNAGVKTREGKPLPDATVVVMPTWFATEGELAGSLESGLTDQFGDYSAKRAIAPGKYHVVALSEPLSNPMTPEQLARLIKLRSSGRMREIVVEPNATVALTLEAVEP
jgi:hypothetical protein